MNSYALFVVVATLLTCVALEVAGLCIPRCSDGNSCTKDLCDDDGICVYATELPVQFGCCMTDRDCRHYCTMPKYHCRESRCECVAGDRTRIDDEDHDFPPEAPAEYEYQYDEMPEDDGKNNDDTTLMVADPTNIVEGGEEAEAGGVPWILIGAIGGVALLVVLILLVGMIAVACVVVSSQGKRQVGGRRYHPASINAPSSSAIVDDDAYYSNSDL